MHCLQKHILTTIEVGITSTRSFSHDNHHPVLLALARLAAVEVGTSDFRVTQSDSDENRSVDGWMQHHLVARRCRYR